MGSVSCGGEKGAAVTATWSKRALEVAGHLERLYAEQVTLTAS